MFARWCELKGLPSIPVLPAQIAAYLADCGSLGPALAWEALQAISSAHTEIGYADPTLSPLVFRAMNSITGIEPPRAFPKEFKSRFLDLPWDIQAFYVKHEDKREREINRAHSEANAARLELAERNKTDGLQSKPSAA